MDKKNISGASKYQKPAISEVELLSGQLLVANQELEDVNECLRRSEHSRNEMLTNLSHDLRAPLTALRSAVDYLKSQPDAPAEERQSMLAVMDRRCKTLEQMVEDLYLLVAMDLPSFHLQEERLELAPFLEEYFTMQQMNSLFDTRKLCCEVSPDFSCAVLADPERLLRVLDNLFFNALKFTKAGDEIALGCRRGPAQWVEFYVRDSGSGIPKNQHEAIFERTYKISAARTPQKEAAASGSGLGLSIIRSIIKKHKGHVWCENAPNRGSVFIVRLPVLLA